MKYVIVDRDGCNVYGVFKTEKEAGQWIFDNRRSSCYDRLRGGG